MKKALVEFEIDMEKMPLGKLSKTQLKNAWKVLNQILGFISKGDSGNINDKSTEFYHLVPHVLKFGEQLPMLATEAAVKSKIEMIDSLLEIETAYSILNSDQTEMDENQNPIDANFDKLKTEIEKSLADMHAG